MKQQVILLLLLVACEAESRSYQADSITDSGAATSTELPPSFLDGPHHLSDLSVGDLGAVDDDSNCAWECYEQVEKAKRSIGALYNLQKKLKELMSPKKAPAHEQSRTRNATRSNNSNTTTTTNVGTNQPGVGTRSVRSRSGQDVIEISNGRPIVVSTLRVARAAIDTAGATNSLLIKRNKRKQKLQSIFICRSLEELEVCLNGISESCIGDLQYHSHEVYFKSSWEKYSCKYNSTTRPRSTENRLLRTGLDVGGSSINEVSAIRPRSMVVNNEPLPTPTNPANKIATSSPFGVTLKPKLVEAFPKKQYQPFDPYSTSTSYRQQNPNSIPYTAMYGVESDGRRPKDVTGGTRQFDNEDSLVIISSQLLIATCFLVSMIIVVSLTGHYITKTRLEPQLGYF